MNEVSALQIIVTAILSSGLVGGIITLFTKKVASPESKNELAKIGNDFAEHLLEEARLERNELRETINSLREENASKKDVIKRLEKIAREKDDVIQALEERQFILARKVELGHVITLQDVFGPKSSPEFLKTFIKEKNDER